MPVCTSKYSDFRPCATTLNTIFDRLNTNNELNSSLFLTQSWLEINGHFMALTVLLELNCLADSNGWPCYSAVMKHEDDLTTLYPQVLKMPISSWIYKCSCFYLNLLRVIKCSKHSKKTAKHCCYRIDSKSIQWKSNKCIINLRNRNCSQP